MPLKSRLTMFIFNNIYRKSSIPCVFNNIYRSRLRPIFRPLFSSTSQEIPSFLSFYFLPSPRCLIKPLFSNRCDFAREPHEQVSSFLFLQISRTAQILLFLPPAAQRKRWRFSIDSRGVEASFSSRARGQKNPCCSPARRVTQYIFETSRRLHITGRVVVKLNNYPISYR